MKLKEIINRIKSDLEFEYKIVNVAIKDKNIDDVSLLIECKDKKQNSRLFEKLNENEYSSIPKGMNTMENQSNEILSSIYSYYENTYRYESFSLLDFFNDVLYDYIVDNIPNINPDKDIIWKDCNIYDKIYWKQFSGTDEIIEALDYLENDLEYLNFKKDW